MRHERPIDNVIEHGKKGGWVGGGGGHGDGSGGGGGIIMASNRWTVANNHYPVKGS